MHIFTLLQMESKVDYEDFCIVQLAYRSSFNSSEQACTMLSLSSDKKFYFNNNSNNNNNNNKTANIHRSRIIYIVTLACIYIL
jgi:hypothetical protein